MGIKSPSYSIVIAFFPPLEIKSVPIAEFWFNFAARSFHIEGVKCKPCFLERNAGSKAINRLTDVIRALLG
jgi:hypothetical protein